MADEQLRAKVFISCGQQRGTDEQTIADLISDTIAEMGFEPYVAGKQQTLQGVQEAVFDALKTSEYFVFVDFKREQIDGGPDCRGSLFSHQELAVASYLGMQVIAFREHGVREGDGLMNFLQQGDEEPFTDRNCVPGLIAEKAQERGWDPHWKNQLRLETVEDHFCGGPDRRVPTHFHINATNLHRSKAALNCQAYLREYRELGGKGDGITTLRTIELKWAGYKLPNATILPGSVRCFDAFRMSQAEPNWCEASSFADAKDYLWVINEEKHPIPKPRTFLLTYVVRSGNFPPKEITCRLVLANRWCEMSFREDSAPSCKHS